MTRILLYYDILYVTHDAPLEVIRAVYKALSQKYHPDKNADNPDAAKIMVAINSAYEVLSNPDKRQKYDLWVKEQVRKAQLQQLQLSLYPRHKRKNRL